MKRFIFIRRRADFTQEQFSRYWRERHAPLILGIPGYRDYTTLYVQNHVAAGAWHGGEFPYHGIAEITPNGSAGGKTMSQTPYYRDLVIPDEAAFIDRDNSLRLQAQEHVVRAGDTRGGMKIIALSATGPEPRQDPDGWSAGDRRRLDDFMDRHDIVACTLYDILEGSVVSMSGAATNAGSKFGSVLELWIDPALAGGASAPDVMDELVAGDIGAIVPACVGAFVAEEARFG